MMTAVGIDFERTVIPSNAVLQVCEIDFRLRDGTTSPRAWPPPKGRHPRTQVSGSFRGEFRASAFHGCGIDTAIGFPEPFGLRAADTRPPGIDQASTCESEEWSGRAVPSAERPSAGPARYSGMLRSSIHGTMHSSGVLEIA